MVNRRENYIIIGLFFCVLLMLVAISCSLSSSVGTARADSSTFGFYFGSPNKNTTSITQPAVNSNIPAGSLNQQSQNETSTVSTYLPLTGQLSKGSYVHLMDLKAFNVVKGDLAMQVPCDYKGDPKVTIIGGVSPNFKTINIGKAIGNANLDGKLVLRLSVNGLSCLYDAVIPAGVTNFDLINTSGQDLNFSQAGAQYALRITAQLK